MDKKIVYKWCFVPKCRNTTTSTPNKAFVAVPTSNPRRKQWFEAAKREAPKSKSVFFCCEDHFDLESDCKNWMFYKTIGSQIVMKQNVVPHKFITSSSIEKLPLASASVFTVADRKRKADNLAKLSGSKPTNFPDFYVQIPSIVRLLYIGQEDAPPKKAKLENSDLIDFSLSRPADTKLEVLQSNVECIPSAGTRPAKIKQEVPELINDDTLIEYKLEVLEPKVEYIDSSTRSAKINLEISELDDNDKSIHSNQIGKLDNSETDSEIDSFDIKNIKYIIPMEQIVGFTGKPS